MACCWGSLLQQHEPRVPPKRGLEEKRRSVFQAASFGAGSCAAWLLPKGNGYAWVMFPNLITRNAAHFAQDFLPEKATLLIFPCVPPSCSSSLPKGRMLPLFLSGW